MPITTKATLETEIGNWLHRTDLTGQYEEWEQMAEEGFKAPPRKPTDPEMGGLRINITRATGTLSTSNPYISKPTGFLSGYSFRLTGTQRSLQYVAPEALSLATQSGTGAPRFWSVADVILLDVIPDSAYAYELAYWTHPVTLVGAASSATNTVIDTYPLCYLAACLHFAFDYIGDAENASKWLGRYKVYANNANAGFDAQRFSSASVASVHGYSSP